jgi:PAS domain S-box-containing protein
LLDVFNRVLKTGISEHYPTAFYQDERMGGWRDNHVSKISSDKIVTIYTDETKRINDDKSLRESEIFFQTVFDTIQDGITVLDTELNILKLNQAMEQWYSPQKPYIGKKCYSIYHNTDSVCEDCPAQRAITSGHPQTKIVNRGGPAGTPGWIELSAFPIVDRGGNIIGAVEYVRNITIRKTAEDKLINSEQQLKEIIDFLPDPTWVIDKDGIIMHWNRALERLTNKKASEMIGKDDYEYAIPFFGKRRCVLIDIALDQNKSSECFYKKIDKEGNILTSPDDFYPLLGKEGIYLSANAAPLYNSSGEAVGAIETVRDITEQKLIEIEKEKSIKNELNEAISEVKLLSSLLPICSSCKKIRDDSGYWNQLESYFYSHSEIKFSHGLCPECIEDLYGKDDWFIPIKNK